MEQISQDLKCDIETLVKEYKNTELAFGLIFLVALGFITFQIFRKKLTDSEPKLTLFLLFNYFGIFGILLLFYYGFTHFTVSSYLINSAIQNGKMLSTGITVEAETSKSLFTIWFISTTLISLIWLKVILDFMKKGVFKKLKNTLVIIISFNSIALAMFAFSLGKMFLNGFFPELFKFLTPRYFFLGFTPFKIFCFSIFFSICLFYYLSLEIPKLEATDETSDQNKALNVEKKDAETQTTAIMKSTEDLDDLVEIPLN